MQFCVLFYVGEAVLSTSAGLAINLFLSCSAFSHSPGTLRSFGLPVNKPRMSPSAGFWCFLLSTGSAFCVLPWYAQVYEGRRRNLIGYSPTLMNARL